MLKHLDQTALRSASHWAKLKRELLSGDETGLAVTHIAVPKFAGGF